MNSIIKKSLLILFFALSFPFFVGAASSGPNSPGTVVDSSGLFGAWTNTSNIGSSNDTYASATKSTFIGYPHFWNHLFGYNFGFSIPSTATINGIELLVERHESAGVNTTIDGEIYLTVGGISEVISGSNMASATLWPTSDTNEIVTYGGPSDTWGLSLTPDDIDSDFSIAFRPKQCDSCSVGKNQTANVDYLALTVYYTEASTSSTTNPPKKVSYPSYTMNFSDGTGSLIAETILPGQVGYVNNYLSTTTPSLPPTPTTEPTPLPVTPQVSDVKQQITSLIQQLIQLLQAEILMMQGQ